MIQVTECYRSNKLQFWHVSAVRSPTSNRIRRKIFIFRLTSFRLKCNLNNFWSVKSFVSGEFAFLLVFALQTHTHIQCKYKIIITYTLVECRMCITKYEIWLDTTVRCCCCCYSPLWSQIDIIFLFICFLFHFFFNFPRSMNLETFWLFGRAATCVRDRKWERWLAHWLITYSIRLRHRLLQQQKQKINENVSCSNSHIVTHWMECCAAQTRWLHIESSSFFVGVVCRRCICAIVFGTDNRNQFFRGRIFNNKTTSSPTNEWTQ